MAEPSVMSDVVAPLVTSTPQTYVVAGFLPDAQLHILSRAEPLRLDFLLDRGLLTHILLQFHLQPLIYPPQKESRDFTHRQHE
jgi:hypothetical protein